MTRRTFFFAAILLIIPAFFVSCSGGEDSSADSKGASAVAYVNGETITKNELEYFEGRLRAGVMNKFISDYSCEYSDGFWTVAFDGKTPEQELYEMALEECVKAKLQFVLCRENGIYDDISYEALYEKAVAYNEENSGTLNAVGVKSIGLSQFYTYYLNNGVLELKNRLAQDKLKPTDEEIVRQLDLLSAKAASVLSEDELFNAAKENAVNQKYDDYVASLRINADVVTL